MKFSSVILAAALPALAAAYDIGCIYPPAMPDPMEARAHMHQYSGSFFMSEKFETPVVIHLAAVSSLCQANCLAYHDDKVLDALTYKRPLVEVPSEYHNSWSRMMCIVQCFAIISFEAGQGDFWKPFYDKWGIEGVVPRRNDVGIGVKVAQEGDPAPLIELLEREDYHPYTVAQVVATEILLHVLDDGWNALGQYTYDTETGEKIKCTASCEPYKDTYGYFPKNHPTGKPENSTTKYIVEGNDKHWAPLTDTDNQGYFTAQQHVTPHIGFHAKPRFFASNDDLPECPDPKYDYYQDSLLIIDHLKNSSGDPMKKQKIAFYDNKLLMINTIETEVKKQFSDKYSFEDELLYIEGMSAGEYDATIMAWREKIRHDLVRPTTVIKRWGSDVLFTFGGNKSVDGPMEIAARDFHSFQRTMPHAEYPSGSSCICTAYSEFTDAFTTGNYNGNVTNLVFGGAGEGEGYGCDPEMDPPLHVAVGCDHDVVVTDMKAILHECSQSRLWAGFHYPAAVIEGEKMCAGVGLLAWDHVQKIRNGSTLGKKFYRGDPRPTCSDPSQQVPDPTLEVERDGSNGELKSAAVGSPRAFLTVLAAATSSYLLYLSF